MVQSDERVDRLIRFVDSTDPRHRVTDPHDHVLLIVQIE